ncbi:MAG TPA: ATP-binding protein [Oxalicibacterium sp.]|nr:ATP-binding protein [Oxalicibacterium sp.]
MGIRDYFYKRGVGWYLALAFSLLSILLTLILSEVISSVVAERIRTTIGNSLSQLALETSDKLDRSMYERYREVRLISQSPELISPKVDKAQKRRTLNRLQDTYPYYAWMGIADLHGKVTVATKGTLEGIDVNKRPWYQNASKGNPYLGDVHDAVLLAALVPKLGSDPPRFVDIAFPYFDDRGIAGVIATHMSWEWAKDIEQSIFQPIKLSRNVQALILAEDGKVLLGPQELLGKTLNLGSVRQARKEASGYMVEKWPDGKSYLVGYTESRGYADYPGLGWIILVRQGAEEAFTPVKTLQQQVLWTGVALAIIFSMLGYLASRKISGPLRALAQAAWRIREGDTATLPATRSFVELRALAGSINALVKNLLEKESALRELNLSLENRVTQRTKELQRALENVQASERRSQTIIEAAQDAYVELDLHGRVTGWNSRAEAMFGWDKHEALGRRLSELVIPHRFQASFQKALNRFDETGEADFLDRREERIVVNRDGVEFPVEMSVGIVVWENSWFFTAFLHDISERKEIARMKDEFISTMSHELRTPLTSIRASLAMLADGMAGEFEPDVKELLGIAYQNCERLVRLINDVLDIEKIESGNLSYAMKRQAVLPLVQQAIHATQGYAAQCKVTLILQDEATDAQINVDGDRMVQVLVNLLSNAIKFSPDGETVTIRVDRIDTWLRISIIDHGPGIPAAFRNRIFQKFAQADSTDSRQKGGSGLGLNICKSIVEGHGGRISYDSEEGQGTQFNVLLPQP